MRSDKKHRFIKVVFLRKCKRAKRARRKNKNILIRIIALHTPYFVLVLNEYVIGSTTVKSLNL